MEKNFREKHLPYFYAYVLGALLDLGEIFTSGQVSVQIMHAKCIHIGLSQDAYPHVEKRMEGWLEILRLQLRDEQTGKPLTYGGTETTMQALDVPDAWGPCQLIFLTNVPPYWKEEVVRTVPLTQGTG